MKYLKKFENFSGQDLGDRFTNEPEEVIPNVMPEGEEVMPGNGEEDCPECGCNCTDCECGGNYEEKEEEKEEETWGDEENNPLVEKKKINKGFQAFLDKQKAKKEGKKEDKKEDKKEEGKTPKTKKEKELAKKYAPKDKITKGDFIAAAIENKKKK